MPSGERWVPTLELTRVEGQYLVCRRGSLFVKERVPDEEVTLRPMASVADYDDAVKILRALRATLDAPGGPL